MLASKGGGLNKCIQRQIITIRYYSARKFKLIRNGESREPIWEWENDKGMLKHVPDNAHSGYKIFFLIIRKWFGFFGGVPPKLMLVQKAKH